LVLLWLAGRLWKSILGLEPDSDPLFKKKHKRFTSVAVICVGALLCVSFLGGVLVGPVRAKQYARDQEIKSLLAGFNAQKGKNSEFRMRLAAIRSVRPSTYEEYYQQCLSLESLLNDWQPDIDHSAKLLTSYSGLLNKYPELRNPRAIATIQFLQDMEHKDAQIFAVVREEIAKVKTLETLPNSQRSAYYKREILPVLANEQKLSDEERAILLEAQGKGVQIPSDLSQAISKR
jgi:hypothetical protein